jgi:hypothetical protein
LLRRSASSLHSLLLLRIWSGKKKYRQRRFQIEYYKK